ncbi:LAFE_0D08482g1_1 [Lachancea fermentati]|uniref:LAFE_0D08482g1_1 n=1 Tax=Lachancea fermentati TaxID=4955 RepID=A0A1G4MBL8_LACFM|nr:LAFE_0D08482g1_1 [Lachancea fermentati]
MHYELLEGVPKDYISDLCIVEGYPHVIATAWDGSISMFDYNSRKRLAQMRHEYPLLSTTWTVGGKKYVGSVQGELLEVDLESERFDRVFNGAQLGISALCSRAHDVIAGSWDGTIEVMDSRSNNIWFRSEINGHKVLQLDCKENTVVAACTQGKVKIYDLRQMENPITHDSGLKFQTRDIKLMPHGKGYVQSSIDGRVAVEYFKDDESRFAFRCHRMNLEDVQLVFPVNSVCFKNDSSMLYTGGSDGKVFSWNLSTRKKSEELPKLEDSVLKLACDGEMLCMATGDDSFKTLPTAQDIELQASKIYVAKL